MSSFNVNRCRICLESNENLYSLHLTNVAVPNSNQFKAEAICLGDIYEQFTQLNYDERGWEWICKECHDKLIAFHQFRLLCIESSSKLSEISTDIYANDGIEDELKDELANSDNDHAFDENAHHENGSDDNLHSEGQVEAMVRFVEYFILLKFYLYFLSLG